MLIEKQGPVAENGYFYGNAARALKTHLSYVNG
jgi:hypothetical protein